MAEAIADSAADRPRIALNLVRRVDLDLVETCDIVDRDVAADSMDRDTNHSIAALDHAGDFFPAADAVVSPEDPRRLLADSRILVGKFDVDCCSKDLGDSSGGENVCGLSAATHVHCVVQVAA